MSEKGIFKNKYISFYPREIRDAAPLQSNNIALWITAAVIFLGYIVFLSVPHNSSKLNIELRKIKTGNTYLYAATVEHSGTTLKSIAKEFIPDLSPDLGAEMIRKRNCLSSIDTPLPIGQMVRLPENLFEDNTP